MRSLIPAGAACLVLALGGCATATVSQSDKDEVVVLAAEMLIHARPERVQRVADVFEAEDEKIIGTCAEFSDAAATMLPSEEMEEIAGIWRTRAETFDIEYDTQLSSLYRELKSYGMTPSLIDTQKSFLGDSNVDFCVTGRLPPEEEANG